MKTNQVTQKSDGEEEKEIVFSNNNPIFKFGLSSDGNCRVA